MRSEQYQEEIMRLQGLRNAAQQSEERERLMAIFGALPKDIDGYSEDAFGSVARIYVLRAFNHADRSDKTDQEWIRLWHKYEPNATVDDLWETAQGYIRGGCGIAG